MNMEVVKREVTSFEDAQSQVLGHPDTKNVVAPRF